jgi:hypothetical protein
MNVRRANPPHDIFLVELHDTDHQLVTRELRSVSSTLVGGVGPFLDVI